jgi:hypothetical protein
MARRIQRSPEPLEARSLLSALIALVDSGVDLTSTTDSPYYDFAAAYDAYDKETAAQYGDQVVQDTSLQHGHGSTVADFIISAIEQTESQPGAGGADVKIMPIRDTSSGLNIDSSALVRGVFWAADHGAVVINLSVSYNADPVLSDPTDPHNGSTLSQAILYAQAKGAVVVTGSGNSALNIDRLVVYPPYADDPLYTTASVPPSNLLVAAAVDASGNLTSVSNWGPIHVDLGAYAGPQGFTSYSSGFTSGVAGVVADLLPPGHSASAVKSVLEQSVTPQAQSVGAWSVTGGVINPVGAVALVMSQGVLLDAGGAAAGSYAADAYYSGGTTYSVTAPIDTSAVASPAPQQVYQTERYGNFTYTIPHLLPNSPYIVRLDFAEIYWDAPGQRLFGVLIGGNPVLTNFDVYAAAGGIDKAISRQFECDSTGSGQIVIQFVTLRDNAKVSGISVTPASDLAIGHSASSSSVEGPGYTPSMAVDGNSSTRWSSGQWMQHTSIGWLSVDLGAPYNISEVRLNWENAYAVNYQIQLSIDGLNWVTIQTVSGNQSKGIVAFPGLLGVGRYVRIYCTQTSQDYDNYSLYDFRVYGTPIADLAQGRPAWASSVESSAYAASLAVDGDRSTRWSSGQWMQNSSSGWISVDLGAPYNISEVRLNWETAYAVDYQIQLSSDNVNWDTIQSVNGNQSKGIVDFPGLSGVGRYVRIYCTQTSSGSDNYSLYDFQVYGAPLADLAQGRPALASSVESSAYAASLAVDGNSSTRWSSGQWMQNTSIGWLSVDLGAPYNISEVRLNWETAFAVDYQIQLSSDGVNWVTIQTVSGNESKGIVDFSGLSGEGRYVRIYCAQTSQGSDNYSLYDFQVYGTPITPSSLQPAGSLTPPATATQTSTSAPAASSSDSGGGLSASGLGSDNGHQAQLGGDLAIRRGAGGPHRISGLQSPRSTHQPHRPRLSSRRTGLLARSGMELASQNPVGSGKTAT